MLFLEYFFIFFNPKKSGFANKIVLYFLTIKNNMFSKNIF